MDKFAVDLEKVLDEFEYNEGRDDDISSPLVKNQLHLSQKTIRSPASLYRRPAFEPINLADADFAAAPIPCSPQLLGERLKHNSLKTDSLNRRSLSEDEEEEDDDDDEEEEEEEEEGGDEVEEEDKSVEEDNKINNREEILHIVSEGTPDLLDSRPSLRSEEETNQLPDITSVRSTPLEQLQHQQLDLVKPNFSTFESASDVPIVHQEPAVKLQIKPITFDLEENVSDSELEEYLDNIVAEAESDEQPLLKLTEEEELSTEETGPVETESTELAAPSDDSSETSAEESLQVQEEVLEPEQSPSFESHSSSTPPPISSPDTAHSPVHTPPSPDIPEPTIERQVDIEQQFRIDNQVNECIESSTVESEEPSNQQPSLSTEEEKVNEQLKVDKEETAPPQFSRPNSLHLEQTAVKTEPIVVEPSISSPSQSRILESDESPTPTNNPEGDSDMDEEQFPLGHIPPTWVPDTESDFCMQCHDKFTVIRRRHHCRACGLVLCSKCCNLKARLMYKKMAEARVCQLCFAILSRSNESDGARNSGNSGLPDDARYGLGRQPNPNNPMEYCSTIPPLQQAATSANQPPPSVLVPSGVLKREGRTRSDVPKQVMFSDGIRPGGDLTELDAPNESRMVPRKGGRRLVTPPGTKPLLSLSKRPLDPDTQSYIPSNPTGLPPPVNNDCGQLLFLDDISAVTGEPVKFAVNNNLFVLVKRVKLDCCVNRECWSICSEGLANAGQDEVAVVLECVENELLPPQDIFHFYNTLYLEGSKGSTVSELSFTPAFSNAMLGSKDHGGFLYIRPTFHCTTNLLLPRRPFVVAVLVHRWETPWARLFPLRLVLRLGAEYRYYPCPLVSIRFRHPLYTDIGHTVMKILVDFRKYSYSLATVRGLLIHMEDRQTTILFPRNRYDQVLRALNNSNDSVLAFGANLSLTADSHLVCIQGTKDENTYHTQAINIHNKPRRVTGASFVVFNGALKISGLSGKSTIVEDGLMVQLLSERMAALRTALRDMVDFTISCGPNDEETVYLKWTDDDTSFNIGVKSVIDGTPLDGIPSIRVHSGTDYGVSKIIRWTEVFIIKSDEGNKITDPLDIQGVSESLARAVCLALVQDIDYLAKANLTIIGVRATIHPENVGYEAGSNGEKLPQMFMNRLDEELIGVLSQAAASSQNSPAVLELLFRIINHP